MKPEAHVKTHLSKVKRSLISQIRNGVLPLEIEMQRYQGVLRAERHCKLCQAGETEDKLHFLFRCDKLQKAHIEMYHATPELLNVNNELTKFQMLRNMPNVFGNSIVKLWQLCERLYNDQVLNNPSWEWVLCTLNT